MENLRGVKIVNKDSLMVENSHLYIKAKDGNYCELTILDKNGKKRKVGATWSSIIDKPTTFPPSTHTNLENEIKITVGTSFASVGQYQRQFNQAVEDWKGSIQTQITSLQNSKQKLLSSYDESILIETDGNIEGNVSLFTEYFQQQVCKLNFIPTQIIGVYKNGIKLLPEEFNITLPKTITIITYSTEKIEIQYTKLKI